VDSSSTDLASLIKDCCDLHSRLLSAQPAATEEEAP
jgi:hypothetical protein